jgi:hypothetical protein
MPKRLGDELERCQGNPSWRVLPSRGTQDRGGREDERHAGEEQGSQRRAPVKGSREPFDLSKGSASGRRVGGNSRGPRHQVVHPALLSSITPAWPRREGRNT